MKAIYLLFICLVLFHNRSHCQELNRLNLGDKSIASIEHELYRKTYPTDSAEVWGALKARLDREKGREIVLYNARLLSHHCVLCQYTQLGYQLIRFGNDDLVIPALDAFLQAYNNISLKNEVQLSTNKSNQIFVISSTIQYMGLQLTDSTFQLNVQLPEWELFFGKELDSCMVEINFTDFAEKPMKYKYANLAISGVVLPSHRKTNFNLRLILDLSQTRPKPEQCWCTILEQRYFFNIPIVLTR